MARKRQPTHPIPTGIFSPCDAPRHGHGPASARPARARAISAHLARDSPALKHRRFRPIGLPTLNHARPARTLWFRSAQNTLSHALETPRGPRFSTPALPSTISPQTSFPRGSPTTVSAGASARARTPLAATPVRLRMRRSDPSAVNYKSLQVL